MKKQRIHEELSFIEIRYSVSEFETKQIPSFLKKIATNFLERADSIISISSSDDCRHLIFKGILKVKK